MNFEEFYKENRQELDLSLQKIRKLKNLGFPIENMHGQYDGISYDFIIIYKNGFWISIYSLCEIFRQSELTLINEIEKIYGTHGCNKEAIKIEFIIFYPIDIILKLSEKFQSKSGMKIYRNFSSYPVMQDKIKLNQFLWSMYEKKDNIFSEIVLTAYNTITAELDKYVTNLYNKGYYYADQIYYAEYGISQLDFLRITIFNFISYEYMKNQKTCNLYQYTKEHFQLNDSLRITNNMSTYKNTYSRLKKEFDDWLYVLQPKANFTSLNNRVEEREKPVSHKISDSGKKVLPEKVLLRHEYKMQEYKSEYKYDKFFLFAKKVLNGTIGDKKHYSDGQVFDALISLIKLYNEILHDTDIPIIDKCMLLDDLEAKYKIEMFYNWLHHLKNSSSTSEINLYHIATLYAFWIDVEYEKSYFPYEIFQNSENGTAIPNTMFYGYDKACEYYSRHMDEFEKYFDFMVAFNVIKLHVIEVLENNFDTQMKEFNYYSDTLLTKFLNDFIGQGQHINFNKNPYEDIDIKHLRYIYQQIIPKKTNNSEIDTII